MTRWSAWLAYAATTLAITPAAFWRLSLREWLALTRRGDAHPLTRVEFATLSSRYPD